MGISKITRNYQVTLPKDVRRIIDVKEGDEVMFIVDDHRVVLTKTKSDIVQRTAGIWRDMKESGVEFQKRIRKESEKRLRRIYGSGRY